MGRAERIAVKCFLGAACPLTAFVGAWWSAALCATRHVLPIGERDVAIAALAGLAAGVLLDAALLGRWARGFYTARPAVWLPLYLFWSAMAVAFFMGLPLGTLTLGTLAGLYAGRRLRHAGAGLDVALAGTHRAALFAAAVTAAEAFPIGLLALHNQQVAALLGAGAGPSPLAGPAGVAFVCIACLGLLGIQYGCTRAAARVAYLRPAG